MGGRDKSAPQIGKEIRPDVAVRSPPHTHAHPNSVPNIPNLGRGASFGLRRAEMLQSKE